jgi:protocatechuate 3,4-dioxygenase beta subunit
MFPRLLAIPVLVLAAARVSLEAQEPASVVLVVNDNSSLSKSIAEHDARRPGTCGATAQDTVDQSLVAAGGPLPLSASGRRILETKPAAGGNLATRDIAMSMRMTASILTLAITGVVGVAQQAGGQAAADAEQKKIRLSGRVVSSSGEPLGKATVRLMPGNVVLMGGPGGRGPGGPAGGGPAGSYSVSTDNEGNFTIDDVAAGRYTLMAERTGFVTQRYGARSATAPGAPLTLKEGDRLTGLTINLTPQAVLAGRVTDQDGDPLQGIQVRASRQVYQGGRRQLRTEGSAITDDQGNYRIANLAPGRYYLLADTRVQGGPGIQAGAAAPGALTEKRQTANVLTYFPNALDWRGASPIELGPGDQRLGVNFQMRRERVYSIRGVAVDLTTNQPAANAVILVLPPDAEVGPGALANQTRTGPDGKFEIHNLPSGVHRLHGSAGGTISLAGGGGMLVMALGPGPAGRGAQSSTARGSVEVVIGSSDVDNVGLVLSGGGQIKGSVRIEGGNVADLQAATQPQAQMPPGLPPLPSPNTFSVQLMPVEGISVNGPTTRTNADGTFEINGAGTEKYAVNVNIPPGQADLYVKSIRFGGADITKSPLDLSAGGGGTLDIVLAKGAGELTGTVVNSKGEAMTGVTVSLWPKIPDLSRADNGVRLAYTDQTGGYRFDRLEPGEYFVVSWEELPDPGLGQYTEFLNRFTGDAQAVTLSAGAKQSAQPRLVDREKVLAELAKLP